MASNRFISTNFWKDAYVEDLDPSEKLLFLYLLTNPNTNIAGIYEISIRQIAFDTGYDKDMVVKILGRFERDGKLRYINGWMALNNWIKHQALNPKVAVGIQRIIDILPDWLKKELLGVDNSEPPKLNDGDTEPMHSLSSPIALNLTKLNLTKPNGTEPQNAAGSNKFDKAHKRQYAQAVRADEALALKERGALDRDKGNGSGSGIESARAVVEKIKARGSAT